jgi:hypothetical protein
VREEAAVGTWQKHAHLAREDLADVTNRRAYQVVHAAQARELPAHRVESGSPPLAVAGRVRLLPDSDRQRADHEGDPEHDRQGHEVLGVCHPECEVGRDKEEIERGDAQDRGENGRAAPEPRGDQHDGQEVHHGQAGRPEMGERQPGDDGTEGHDADGRGVRRPVVDSTTERAALPHHSGLCVSRPV